MAIDLSDKNTLDLEVYLDRKRLDKKLFERFKQEINTDILNDQEAQSIIALIELLDEEDAIKT